MGRKIIFIIPGFRHKPTSKNYKRLTKILKKEGYYPIPVAIPWKQATISQNTQYFLKKYKKMVSNSKPNQRKPYVLGFSFGAMIAFLASTKVPVKGLILCSLSPYFREDLQKKVSQKATALQKRRFESFSQLQSKQLAKKIKAKKIMMLYGAKESKVLIKRVTRTYKQIPPGSKYLFPIRKAEHNIGGINYLQAIHEATKIL